MVSNNSYQEYQKYLKAVKADPKCRFKLPRPDHEETLGELVAEGLQILEGEELAKKGGPPPVPKTAVPPKDEKQRLETALASTSDNSYIKARIQILNKMTPEARGVIEKMEKGTLKKDSRYDKFVEAVIKLGDTFSN